MSPQWDVHLANTGKLRFAVDYTHTASLFNDAPNTPLLARPATDNLAASIAYYSPEEKYVVTFGGSNLTDDRYLVGGLGERRGRRDRGHLQSAAPVVSGPAHEVRVN